jgi:phenylpropionate dioxygenase-like ring-hydroxylating dioxygenase large terminal subunit
MSADERPPWARALVDPATFDREQARLGRVWTLLGLTTEITDDGDWIRATLGGRSVFVQRFGDAVVGFENVCAHRFFPLRTKDSGNGPIRCGFHHWQYDRNGRAVGIPKCMEMYGKSPREMDVRLNPVSIQTCGMLIFGRFPSPDATDSLEQFLGDGFAILQAMCDRKTPPHLMTRKVAANWKLCFHVTLDDYHLVAVHPSTFGKIGYLDPASVLYYRFGDHSAYFHGAGPDSLKEMTAECRDGSYRPSDYRIFQFFPNLIVVLVCAAQVWYTLVIQYVPVATDRSLMRTWYFPAPFPADGQNWRTRLIRALLAPWLPFAVRYYHGTVSREDHQVCERIQSVAHQIEKFPILSLHEQRIRWFEEVYDRAMTSSGVEGAG